MGNSFYWELRRDASKNSRLFELARLLVRLDHVVRFIVNANNSAASDFQAIVENPEKFKAFVSAAERKNRARACSTRAPIPMKMKLFPPK
jgi:hypothetical protein